MSLKTYEEAFNSVMEEILDIVKIQPSQYTISFEKSKALVFSEYFKLKGNNVMKLAQLSMLSC